uniref:DEP domain-containing protein n=1 Tax=Panagrellus redivivus TaxID=6233 RepID=A0A7E4ZZ36_PANRE
MSDAGSSSFTTVYYYLDGATPFKSEVPVPPEKITLGDFKRVFDRQNYKYFCKEFDPMLKKDVKVELTKDSQKLNKSESGVIQLVLLPVYPASARASDSSGGTLPRASRSDTGRNPPRRGFAQPKRALSITDETDYANNRYSLATDPASTAYSRRAGEQMAETLSSSDFDDDNEREDTSDEEANRESGSSTSCRRPHGNRRNRQPRAYVPSSRGSKSATSQSDSLPGIAEICIQIYPHQNLGFNVADHDGGIFISDIFDDTAAGNCPDLSVGDQILEVNSVCFEHLTFEQALAQIKKATKTAKSEATETKPGKIKMHVARLRVSDQHSESGLSAGLGDTIPFEVSEWVMATTAENVDRFDDPLNNSRFDDGGVTSDEERAAYIDRRNGVGARLVPALHNFRSNNGFDVPSSPHNRNHPALLMPPPPPRSRENDENEFLNAPLSVDTDPITILKRMVHPASGLEITTRKWLKIPFPDSFIGNEMLAWLMEHVEGLKNKKAARKYAASLLTKGLIRHVLDGKQFDKKRYYFFADNIISYRRQIEHARATASASRLPTSATAATEVTFLGSPSYPPPAGPTANGGLLKSIPASCGALPSSSNNFFSSQNTYLTGSRAPTRSMHSQQRLPQATRSPYYPAPIGPAMYMPQPQASPGLPQWPISPLIGSNERRPSCTSPVTTNEYASMINAEVNSNYMSVPTLPRGYGNARLMNNGTPPPNTPNTALQGTASRSQVPIQHR